MKINLIIAILLASVFSYGQTKPKLSDEEKFNKCVLENTNYFTFDGQKPIGKGWTILENLFADNQFVAWGEFHNSPVLSKLTSFALESAYKNGYKTWCIETSPFIATELMRIGKTKNPVDTIIDINAKGIQPYGSIPFFSTKEDAQMLVTANKLNYTIWGIDQEFQMAFPYCIDKIYYAQSNKIKEKYKSVKDSLKAKWWNPETLLLDSLKNAIPQEKFKIALDDIKISKEIYQEDDAQVRATLMKKNFFTYYDNLKTKNEKVFFKMGNNHLARGMNFETQLYDIGNAVFELSQRNKTSFANVYLMVRYSLDGDKIIDDVEGDKHENPKVFSKLYDKEKWVLVDVRPLRRRMRNDNTLTIDTYKVIEKYDFVLISPEILK